jgi:hypothetical protein
MNLKSNVLIFSVFQKSVPAPLNEMAHRKVLSALKSEGLPVLELQGRYNGVDEMSILVDGFEHRRMVERLCQEFGQECYLESHNDRATNLVFPDGSTQSIGTLVPVSKEEALAVGNFSYNGAVGQYFVTR